MTKEIIINDEKTIEVDENILLKDLYDLLVAEGVTNDDNVEIV